MIYVLSDIHGNQQRFSSILGQIDLQPQDTLYVLGDVIDRHPGGIRILRQLMAMPNARLVLGNHEYMMLRALGHPKDSNIDDGNAQAHWYRNGGQVTLDHFNRLCKTLQAEIVDYLLSLPLHYNVQVNGVSYKLVHAAPAESYEGETDPKYLNPIHYAVWKRWDISDPPPGDYTLIFGHTPTDHYQDVTPMEVWFQDRRIGIDCGCAYPSPEGRLACLRLDDMQVFYSQEDPVQ
jgi:serine/threonine protein phosphatase 1